MSDPRLSKALKWAIENSSDNNQSTTNGEGNGGSADSNGAPRRGLDPEILAAILGGPSDADLMKESMIAIHSPSQSHANKMVAWDNFEQLIESLDNANNMQNLGLWPALVAKYDERDDDDGGRDTNGRDSTEDDGTAVVLSPPVVDNINDNNKSSPAAQIRQMAFWCTTTAVQNNMTTQEHFHATAGALEKVVHHALYDADLLARRKAVNALSSCVRNYQVALDRAVSLIPPESGFRPRDTEIGVEEGSSSSSTSWLDAGDMDAVDVWIGRLRENAARPA